MKTLPWILIFAVAGVLMSCHEEDPGPRQNDSRSYALVDFDRLEMGDAFIVTVQKGAVFSISAEGDRRNLDDLMIYKSGTTLIAKYDNYRNRQYNTYINIVMPELNSINFSGAVNAKVIDFSSARLDVTLSGATLAQLDMDAAEVYANVSGASQLRLTGEGQKMEGVISGASLINTFEFPAREGKLIVSGASTARVTLSEQLRGDASGASVVLYRGNPIVDIKVSGSSVVRKD